MERQIEEDQAKIAEDSEGRTSEKPLQAAINRVAKKPRTTPNSSTSLGGGCENRKLQPCHALKGKRSGNVWFQLGKEVGFREANKSNVSVGRIIGQRKGWTIVIEAWAGLPNATRSTRHKNGMPTWIKPVEAQRITIKDTLAFPISTTLTN